MLSEETLEKQEANRNHSTPAVPLPPPDAPSSIQVSSGKKGPIQVCDPCFLGCVPQTWQKERGDTIVAAEPPSSLSAQSEAQLTPLCEGPALQLSGRGHGPQPWSVICALGYQDLGLLIGFDEAGVALAFERLCAHPGPGTSPLISTTLPPSSPPPASVSVTVHCIATDRKSRLREVR